MDIYTIMDYNMKMGYSLHGLSKSKIIFIEDDRSMRELLYEILKNDFEIIVTGSTQEALSLCENENIALVMSDHHMRPITGVDFLKTIYEEHPDIRRVLITGDRSSKVVVDAVQKGHIHGIFYKPLDFEKLKRDLNEHINRFIEHQQATKTEQNLRSEITRLRNALYAQNSQIYKTFSALRGSDGEVEFANLKSRIEYTFNIHLKNLLEIHNNEGIPTDPQSIRNILHEISLIADEFNLGGIYFWSKIMQVTANLVYGTRRVIDSIQDVSHLKLEVQRQSNNFCEGKLLEYIHTIEDITSQGGNISDLKKLLYQQLAELKRDLPLLLEFDQPAKNNLIDNLGYFMVVINQVTAYYKKFNAKTDLNPSLIGNMAIALNDFSREIFDDFEGVQVVKQQNGSMLIHQADKDIYFIAMTYQDSSYYKIWLQEFASQTLDFFKQRVNNIRFEENEIDNLDLILDGITGLGTFETNNMFQKQSLP